MFKSSILFVTFALLITFFSENIQQRFFISEGTSSIKNSLSSEPRYHIWDCGFNLNQNYSTLLFGRGFIGTERELTDCYSSRTSFLSEDQKQWFVKGQFNTHNQFLDFFLSQGIISLLLFIFILFFLLKEYRKNYYALCCILITFMFLFTENVMHRQLGCMLLGLCFAISLKINKIKNQLN